MHMLLPHLEAFRFALVGHDDDLALFSAVVQLLRSIWAPARGSLCAGSYRS